jgi:WhiB family redox-sensing transcriptional regulator
VTIYPPIAHVPGRLLAHREPAGLRRHGIAASEDWMADAACREDVDPEIFFVSDKDPRAARLAKNVCQTCPVRGDCAEYAIKRPNLFGIWGGLTDAERWKFRR